MHTRDITAVSIAIVILVGLFIARSLGDVGLHTLNALNDQIFIFINSLSRFTLVAIVAPVITHVGDQITIAVLLVACIAFACWMRPLRVWVAGMCLAAGVMAILIVGLKPMYHVNRPITTVGTPIYYYSTRPWFIGTSPVPLELVRPEHKDPGFPSGHATIAFALAGVIWHARRWRWPMILLATLVGVSRICIGVHFPADVLTGAALGFLIGFLTMHWLEGQGKYASKIRSILIKEVQYSA